MAAGRGSRLKKYSKYKPKSFIRIYRTKRIIDYQISVLKKIKVKKIIIVVGFKKELFFKEFSKEKKINFIINNNWKNTNVLESFSLILDHLNEDFIFMHADSLVEHKLYKSFLNSNCSILPYKEKKKCPDEDMKLYLKKRKIILTKKDIINCKPKGEFLGIAFFKKELVKELKKKTLILKKSKDYSNLFFEDLINKISNKYNIKLKNIKNLKFVEIDFEEDLIEAKKTFEKYLSKYFYK